jgi:uncharacterized membrane protein YfcA
MDPYIIVFGLGVGILVGLTGMGGGSLMTPLLIIVFGVSPVTAVGTDLAYAAVTKTVGGYKHFRQKTVDVSLSWWMAFGSIPSAVGGVYVLELLEEAYGERFDEILLAMLSGALLFTGVCVLARALFLPKMVERERHTIDLERRHKVSAVVIGVFVGFVLGVTSAGSGALIAVALILVFRLVPQRVVGTDVFHAALLLWAAAFAHLVAGNIDYGLAGTILIGSVPGVWLGSHWSVRMPVATLRMALGIVLVGAGLGLAVKAGADIPAPVLGGVPLSLAAYLIYKEVRRRREAAASPAADEPSEPVAVASTNGHTPAPPAPERVPVPALGREED